MLTSGCSLFLQEYPLDLGYRKHGIQDSTLFFYGSNGLIWKSHKRSAKQNVNWNINKGVSIRVKKMTIPKQQHGQPIWNSWEKLLCFRVRSCSIPSIVLKTLLLTCLLLLLWRTPPFFMQKVSSIHENVQRLAADVSEVKIYIKSGLKSDRFRMYTENFRISHNVCLLFYFWQFFKTYARRWC